MIKRCTDLRRVKHLAPEWDLIFSDKVFYLIEEKDGEDLGVIVFMPIPDGSNDLVAHVELGEKCRGKCATKAYKDAFRWIFDNTDCECIFGEIPDDNRAAHIMARRAGGAFDGIAEKVMRCYSLTKQNFTRAEGYA